MSESLFPSAPRAEATPTPEPPLVLHVPRPVLLGSFVLLLGFVGIQTPRLWTEYGKLRRAWAEESRNRVIAFRGVGVHYSAAAAPENWFREDGADRLLWAGWDRKAKTHRWFQLGERDIDPSRLSHSLGRDTMQAIQAPMFEGSRGEYWDRIPLDHTIYAWEKDSEPLAFPVGVLDKVAVVNTRHVVKPMVVVYTPFVRDETSVEAYNPIVGNQILTFGNSGYLIDLKPLFYDRQDMGLWKVGPDGLVALSGPRKGVILKRLGRLRAESWGDFRASQPTARVLVGADRSKEAPG